MMGDGCPLRLLIRVGFLIRRIIVRSESKMIGDVSFGSISNDTSLQ